MGELQEIKRRYQGVKVSTFEDRYLPPKLILSLIKKPSGLFSSELLGESVLGNPIYGLRVGHGDKIILGWSQMHGNESTTTKAVFDLLAYLDGYREEDQLIDAFLSAYSFYLVPMLNPDGALAYTRENAAGVDLNRDAKDLSQPESRVLMDLFTRIGPQLCLNLHGQRSIYGMPNGNPSIVSFLAPSADKSKTITPARAVAMEKIGEMAGFLHLLNPGCIGRYDDEFNGNCVGDTFQGKQVPTILFEAGHSPGDYNRAESRELIFLALARLFGLVRSDLTPPAIKYENLPEHRQNYRDLILRNVCIGGKTTDLAIQLQEELVAGSVQFVRHLDMMGDLPEYHGHMEVDLEGQEILINSHENVCEGDKVLTIHRKIDNKLMIFLQIP